MKLLTNRISKNVWVSFLAFRGIVFLILYPIIISALPICVSGKTSKGAFILLLMAGYWITEVIPLYVTALLPVLLAPLLGIAPSDSLTQAYFRDTNMLFFGSLLFACAMEHNNLHKRIALFVLRLTGGDLKMLLLGCMLPTWFLSMWMSNTATTAMMVPIVDALLISLEGGSEGITSEHQKIEPQEVIQSENGETTCDTPKSQLQKSYHLRKTKSQIKKFSVALSLCVCYAATCGGMGTITGTLCNSIMFSVLRKHYGPDTDLTFGKWMAFAVPVAFVMLLFTWLWLTLLYLGPRALCSRSSSNSQKQMIKNIIKKQADELGHITYGEKVCGIFFLLVACLWITRRVGTSGWGRLFATEGDKGVSLVTDTQPAILVAFLVMIIPAMNLKQLWKNQKTAYEENSKFTPLLTQTILPWHVAQKKFPWGVIILTGGGYALSDVCQLSGLSKTVGIFLSERFQRLPTPALILVCSLTAALLTEFTANAATASILLPIMIGLADSLQLNPLLLLLPATIGTSLSFSLPASNPPNSIVFSHGRVQVNQMIRTGICINLMGNIINLAAVSTYGTLLFNLNEQPQWAINATRASF